MSGVLQASTQIMLDYSRTYLEILTGMRACGPACAARPGWAGRWQCPG